MAGAGKYTKAGDARLHKPVFELLAPDDRAKFLNDLLAEYVEALGLGSMQKTDLDALILFLFRKYSADKAYDVFDLSVVFGIKESKVKSLLQLGALKFGRMQEDEAWDRILAEISNAVFELESLEKGQIRFRLSDPILFPYMQRRVRDNGSTVAYSATAEVVTMSLLSLFRIMDEVRKDAEKKFSTTHLDSIHVNIEKIFENIKKSLDKATINELKGEKGPKRLQQAIKLGAELASVGQFVVALLSA